MFVFESREGRKLYRGFFSFYVIIWHLFDKIYEHPGNKPQGEERKKEGGEKERGNHSVIRKKTEEWFCFFGDTNLHVTLRWRHVTIVDRNHSNKYELEMEKSKMRYS